MSFGAFCPGLRLRDSELDGWAATQHARASADVTAAKRTCGLSFLTYTLSGGTVSGTAYQALNGNGASLAPTATVLGTGAVRWTWPLIRDSYDIVEPVHVKHAKATAHGSSPVKAMVEISAANQVTVRTFTTTTGAPVDAKVTLKAWASGGSPIAPVQDTTVATIRPDGRPAWSHDSDIGDYGGDPDKHDCVTEAIPYAWVWYREIGGQIGSMFTDSRTGEVHAKKLALARNLAGVDRCCERARNNGLPHTADEALGSWVNVLGIQAGDTERRWRIRKRAAAKFAAMLGPSKEAIDTAIIDMLGSALVTINRNYGTVLSVPPTQTFWPVINPGPPVYSLGGGTWLSERSKLSVIATKPSDVSLPDFVKLMDVQLFSVLDPLLPAWAEYYWAISSTGFILDFSQLDLDGLTPT